MKKTIVKEDGTSYQQEIKARETEKILEYIERQTRQHLELNGDSIPMEARTQLEQLLDSISTKSISSSNIDAYLSLWNPTIYDGFQHDNGKCSKPTVSLTLYFDGDNQLMSFLPSTYFDIYETMTML